MTRSLVLGLDASERRVGWALVDYETAELVEVGCEFTFAGDDLKNRRSALREIARVANLRGDVFAVFVEDAYAGPSRARTVKHACAVGNVEAFALERWPKILVERLAPATWRSILGLPAKGKTGVWAWARARDVYERLKIQDEADALAIATAGHALVWEVEKTNTAAPEPMSRSDVGPGEKTRKATSSPNGKEANGD